MRQGELMRPCEREVKPGEWVRVAKVREWSRVSEWVKWGEVSQWEYSPLLKVHTPSPAPVPASPMYSWPHKFLAERLVIVSWCRPTACVCMKCIWVLCMYTIVVFLWTLRVYIIYTDIQSHIHKLYWNIFKPKFSCLPHLCTCVTVSPVYTRLSALTVYVPSYLYICTYIHAFLPFAFPACVLYLPCCLTCVPGCSSLPQPCTVSATFLPHPCLPHLRSFRLHRSISSCTNSTATWS